MWGVRSDRILPAANDEVEQKMPLRENNYRISVRIAD
jgi:hypothetical protein